MPSPDEVERHEDVAELLDEASPPQPTGGVEKTPTLESLLLGLLKHAAPAGTQDDGDFVGYYVIPTGPVHRAMAAAGVDTHGDVAGISRYQADLAAERTKSAIAELEALVDKFPDFYSTDIVEQRLAELRGKQ